MSKVRRVNFYPDEYIAGVVGQMNAYEQAVYWMVCAMVMSGGGAIKEDHRRIGMMAGGLRPSHVKRIIDGLVEKGKLQRNGDEVVQKRARSEVELALKRIQSAAESGSKGGRSPRKIQQNQQNAEANACSAEKLTNNNQPVTSNQQPSETADPPDKVVGIGMDFEPDEPSRQFAEKMGFDPWLIDKARDDLVAFWFARRTKKTPAEWQDEYRRQVSFIKSSKDWPDVAAEMKRRADNRKLGIKNLIPRHRWLEACDLPDSVEALKARMALMEEYGKVYDERRRANG